MKKEFLRQLATLTLEKYGTNLSSQCFVFPSRRAGVFFLHHLASIIEKPIFSPKILTIQDLMVTLSSIDVYDNIQLASLLYNEFKLLYTTRGEAFDQYPTDVRIDQCLRFIADFNDIDNYLIDARMLFRNIMALEELTTMDYLTEKQKDIIKDFWNKIIPKNRNKERGHIEKNFVSTLDMLWELYTRFKKLLITKKIGYAGIPTRYIAEMNTDELNGRITTSLKGVDTITIAGLYAITPAEEKALKNIRNVLGNDKLSFYWEAFMESEDESLYRDKYKLIAPFQQRIVDNQKRLGGSFLYVVEPSSMPQIEHITSSSSIAGKKVLPSLTAKIIKQDPMAISDLKTAVLVSDEKALPALLSSLKGIGESLNITMGYPFSQSNVCIWLIQYIDALLSISYRNNEPCFSIERLHSLIRHPLTSFIIPDKEKEEIITLLDKPLPYIYASVVKHSSIYSDSFFLQLITDIPNTGSEFLAKIENLLAYVTKKFVHLHKEMEKEGISMAFELELIQFFQNAVLREKNVLSTLGEELSIASTARLLLKIASTISIPFQGEPLNGLQVMGFLESRLLSFDYLIFPDANEGMLPNTYDNTNSYIPYNLRVGYGLPTYRTKEEIEAYYFYRLILGARKVYLISGGDDDGEVSRYIHQLKFLTPFAFRTTSLVMPIANVHLKEECIESREQIAAVLSRYLISPEGRAEDYFSASALNTYITCRRRFYYKYVRKIPETDINDEIPSPAAFGNVIHRSMESIYKPYENALLNRELLTEIIASPRTKKIVHDCYQQEVLCSLKAPIDGIHQIYCDTAYRYILAVLEHDRTYNDLKYIEGEKKVFFDFPLQDGRQISFIAYIDRVDTIIQDGNEILRLVDYKTGSDRAYFTNLEKEVLAPTTTNNKAVSQLFLYAYFMNKKGQNHIQTALYTLRHMVNNPNFSPLITEKDKGKNDRQVVSNYALFKASTSNLYLPDYVEERVSSLLEEIFSYDNYFPKTLDTFTTCKYCPYRQLCNL